MFRALRVVCLLAALTACTIEPIGESGGEAAIRGDQPVDVDVRGTVRWVDLEGGFWAIRGDDQVTYDPRGGVPADFQHDGLRVHLRARTLRDAMSIRMVGPIVEIVELRRI